MLFEERFSGKTITNWMYFLKCCLKKGSQVTAVWRREGPTGRRPTPMRHSTFSPSFCLFSTFYPSFFLFPSFSRSFCLFSTLLFHTSQISNSIGKLFCRITNINHFSQHQCAPHSTLTLYLMANNSKWIEQLLQLSVCWFWNLWVGARKDFVAGTLLML